MVERGEEVAISEKGVGGDSDNILGHHFLL